MGRGSADKEVSAGTTPRSIKVISVDGIGDGSAVNFDGAIRQPFAYDAKSRCLFLGRPGMHHGEIFMADQWPESLDMDECFQGEVVHTPFGVVFNYESAFEERPDADQIFAQLQREIPELQRRAGAATAS